MIVVEGIDASGKTTLAKMLSREFNLELHPSPGPGEAQAIRDQAWESLNKDNIDQIWDRARFISEAVYGPALRGAMSWTTDEWLTMLRVFCSRPQLVIYCNPPMSLVEENWDGPKQLSGVWEKRWNISADFDSIMWFLDFVFTIGDNGSQLVTYNWKEADLDKVRNAVVQYGHAHVVARR